MLSTLGLATSSQTSYLEVDNSDSNRMPVANSTSARDGIPDSALMVFHIAPYLHVARDDARRGSRSSCIECNSLNEVPCA